MNKQKGFAPIVVVLIIIVLLIGGYFIFRKSSSTTSTNKTLETTMIAVPSGWPIYHDPTFGFSVSYPSYYTDLVPGHSDDQSAVSFFDKRDLENYRKSIKTGLYDARELSVRKDLAYAPRFRDPDNMEKVTKYPNIKVGSLVFEGMSYELVSGWYENPAKPGTQSSRRTSPEDTYTETSRTSEMTYLATDGRNTYMFLYSNFDSIEPGRKATTETEKAEVKQRIADLQKMVASFKP